MSPSKLARRTGIVAGGTFLLAMAASPAYAIGGLNLPAPALNTPCVAGVSLPSTLQCLNGVITSVTKALPLPTSAPTTTAPSPSPSTNPLSGVTAPLTGTLNKLGQTVTGLTNGVGTTVGGVTGGTLPSLPAAPSSPANPVTGATGTATTPATGKTGTKSGSTPTGSKTSTSKTAQPKSDGSSLLGPAAAFLPGSGVATFADLGSSTLVPLADNIPSPLLASPEAKLAAVQAPLIAAGDRASSQADSVFSRFAGKALPGILVVLATAMVAAVGAGNLRAWQARLAAKRAKVSA